jgi:DNA-directed RNA polymerase subunit D
MMKITVLKSRGERLEFLLEESTPAFANALRRIMVSEIPTMAVEWVDFHENSSALYDEIIAHRLAMIPIKFDPSKFNMPDQCKCNGDGCSLCQVVFAVEKTGPCVVHSGDMKSSNKAVGPTDPNFPITELLKGQKLKLEAVARLGTGKKHAKWQAANASYQYYPEIKIRTDDYKNYIKDVPKSAITIQGKNIQINDFTKTDLLKKAVEESENSMEFVEDPARFVFSVESVSGLDPDYIVSTAAQILAEKAEEFKKQVAKI